MQLIVGLGNVGEPYADTRHNAGFMVVEQLAHRQGIGLSQRLVFGRRLAARWGEWRAARGTVRLLLPQTMMNLSGEALRAAGEWAVPPQQTLIVCDDVNLPLGRLRLRAQGSDGGQHGLASCLAALGTEEVPRLRVGVGAERLPKDLTAYVLSPFTAEERPAMRRAIEQAVEACEIWVNEGLATAMNRVNGP